MFAVALKTCVHTLETQDDIGIDGLEGFCTCTLETHTDADTLLHFT